MCMGGLFRCKLGLGSVAENGAGLFSEENLVLLPEEGRMDGC